MGEQGAESIHAHMMRLERTYQGVVNEVDRLKYIIKEHMLESAPSLTYLRPPIKKRKLEDEEDNTGTISHKKKSEDEGNTITTT